MLMPVLTSVNTQLESGAFEGQHLSMVVWSLANLIWGFAKLNYKPSILLPHITGALFAPGMLERAKGVEVADLGFALGEVGTPGALDELLGALAARAAPDGVLRELSSRQICKLVNAFAKLEAAALLPA